MRIVDAPKVALALSAALAFLVIQVPEPSRANPAEAILTAVSIAITLLEPLISGYVAAMRSRHASHEVSAKLWMHTGDRRLNGCGFYFQVDGHSGRTTHAWFPDEKIHNCEGADYRMKMTSQSAAYEKSLRVGNDQVNRIEFHADGWTDTEVKSVCFGLSSYTIVNGPRAFCVNNDLLKACKREKSNWTDIDLDHKNMILTRTTRGIHKIIFKDVEGLVNAYESIGGSVDGKCAADMICDKIELVRGRDTANNNKCQADRFWSQVIAVMDQVMVTRMREREDKNPYGCDRYEGSK